MIRSKAEAEIEAYEVTENARIESIDNEREKLLEQDKLEDELFEKRKRLLEQQIEIQKEGSTARAELENELNILKANAAAEDKLRTKELTDFDKEQAEERVAKAKEESERKKQLDEATEAAKIATAQGALGAIAAFAKEGSDLAKGVAVAQTTISTYEAAAQAYKSTVGIPVVGPALAPIAAAAAAASGIAQVRNILSTDPMKGGGSGAGSRASRSQGGAVAANTSGPQFNIVQAQQQTRLLSDISGAVGQPARAYVVSSDVSTAQALERKRIKNASF